MTKNQRMSSSSPILIYTDGSCIKNPGGPGGWAFVLIESEREYLVSSGCKVTTNNRMELTAVIEALSFVTPKSRCVIYSDSQLVINCALGKWKRKANLDLWELYDIESKDKDITFEWVKGHSGNKYNEIVDKLALNEARTIEKLE